MKQELSLQKYLVGHCYLMLIGVLLALFYQLFYAPVFLMILSVLGMIVLKRQQWLSLKPFGGYANWATLFRFVLLVVVLFNLKQWSIEISGSLLILFLLFDGVDGYLARKFNCGSELGATLDMESDAFYCAMLSVFWFEQDADYVWFLFPGLLRYGYTVLIHLLRLSGRIERLHPKSKWFAVAFFIALVSPFFLPKSIAIVLLSIATGLIVFSFSYAFYCRVIDKAVVKQDRA